MSGICECDPGYIGAKCTEDEDECKTQTHQCDDNGKCINNIGSYTCKCKEGFILDTRDSHSCMDVDECAEGMNKICSRGKPDAGGCENTIGSYHCYCKPGYALDQSSTKYILYLFSVIITLFL